MQFNLAQRTSLGWILLATAALVTGCATTGPRQAYPTLDEGQPASVLRLDNTIADSAWAMQFKAPIGLKVTIDGFAPADKAKLKAGGQIGPGKVYLPTGVTEVRMLAGSHTMVHEGKLLGKKQYRFNPVTMTFDTEEGKTYIMRFKQAGTILKPAYLIEYEGWDSEQTSQWPNEVSIANPLFGR
jgi:hypothetical protein